MQLKLELTRESLTQEVIREQTDPNELELYYKL